MPALRISIITPSFNQSRYIQRTIESVLGQSGDFELEYLIYDGGSSDGTLEILRSYGSRIKWVSERDHGQTDAINKGLNAATGEVVGWLNSDDVLAPGALSKVADAFRSDPNLEWLHGRCEIIDSDDKVIRPWISAYKHWCCKHYSYRRLLTENFISQMTVFWRRKVHDDTGYLDTGLKLAFDYELWLRLGKRSDPLYIPSHLASFRWYVTSKSGARFDEQFREDYVAAARHAPGRPWVLFHKRFKTLRMLAVYKVLSMVRGWGQPKKDGF